MLKRVVCRDDERSETSEETRRGRLILGARIDGRRLHSRHRRNQFAGRSVEVSAHSGGGRHQTLLGHWPHPRILLPSTNQIGTKCEIFSADMDLASCGEEPHGQKYPFSERAPFESRIVGRLCAVAGRARPRSRHDPRPARYRSRFCSRLTLVPRIRPQEYRTASVPTGSDWDVRAGGRRLQLADPRSGSRQATREFICPGVQS